MRLIAFICLLLLNNALLANADEELAELQKAISDKDFITAQKLFTKDTTELINRKKFLELSYFIPYAGYIADHFGKDGMKAVEDFRDFILNSSDNLRVKRQAYLEIHTYYRDNGKYQLAYDMNAKALEISHRIPDCEPREWAMIERNLGVIATELNQSERAMAHVLRASEGYDLDPKTNKPDKLNTYNILGAIYWYEAQYDSVEYYWTKGLSIIDSMEQTLVNQYYYRSMLEGNLTALYDVTGRTNKSIKTAKDAIRHTKYFIENGKNESRWNRALSSLLYQSNNLAATYQGIGNYSQALKLFEFILQEKLEHYPDNHPETFFSKIQVGRCNYNLKNFAEAKKWLNKGIDGYKKLDENHDKNLADAYSTLAYIAEEEGNNEEAEIWYNISEEKYAKAFKGKFDFVYLDFLTHVSDFYSLNDKPEKAIELSQKGLDYISNSYSKNSLVGFRQNLNVGNVWYNLKEYEKALQYAEECLEILDNIKNTSESGFDSLRTYFDKPSAILLKEKSSYELQKNKSAGFLLQIHQTLKEALVIIDKRKTVLTTHEDQQMLMVRFKELIGFTQKILLELYGKTGKTDYIDELVKLQESMVYTKIRSQLNLIENIEFYNLPKEISAKEKDIKAELQNLTQERGNISDYLEKMNQWQNFLSMLQLNYPEYYKLRYTGLTPDSTINNMTSAQIVKYIFIDSDLLAVVYTKNGQKAFKLNFNAGLINQIPNVWDDPQSLGKHTAKLYQQLWEPFDTLLTEPRVMVIPDGVLFNLSFEMLSPKPDSRFTDFSDNSLLAKYDFSYHFSLWLSQNHGSKQIKPRYVGFVPGFSDQMKENYVSSVTDSFAVDKEYLRLLPQPFTVKLVNTISKRLRGKNYAYEESTAATFKQKASGNKIIHIGTHAESDNVSPAYSRLLFAKSNAADEDNSLYAYEIYGTNMTSNITLLTACETGNPVYQPGEGMISLAHAFQYSGSESLLTSLWNQDEKAGMEISGYFLGFLSRGMAKDKALKEAKLKYLANNHGRSLSPQYWAGLILVGNPESLEGLKPVRTWYWIGGGIFLILLILYIFIYRKGKKQV